VASWNSCGSSTGEVYARTNCHGNETTIFQTDTTTASLPPIGENTIDSHLLWVAGVEVLVDPDRNVQVSRLLGKMTESRTLGDCVHGDPMGLGLCVF